MSRQRPQNPRTPILTMMLVAGMVLGTPIALYVLFTFWQDSLERQVAGVLGIAGLGAFLRIRYKYEALILALLFLTQFRVPLYSIPLARPAELQFFLTDVFLALFLVAAFERGERMRLDPLAKLFAGLIAWQTMSALFYSAHLDRSLIYIFWQIKYLLVYVFLQNIVLTEEIARKLKIAVILVIAIQAILALAQQATGGMLGLYVFGEQDPTRLFFANRDLRVSGTLGATNGFAGYMAMLLVAVLPFMFRQGGLFQYAIYGSGMIALLVTFSRAGWLSFVCGALLVTLVLVRTRVIRVTRIMISAALIVLLIGVGVNSYYAGVQERFKGRDAIGAAEGRVTQFSAMWPAIEKHPVFGIGPGVTEYFGAWNDNNRYIRDKLPGIRLGNQPHNSQLQMWIESGTPAFIIFVLMLLMILRGALVKPEINRESRQVLHLRIGAAAAAAAAMIDASFGPEINSHQISLAFWMFLGISRNRSQVRARPASEPDGDNPESERQQQIGRDSGHDALVRE